jgi:hypothetical protein
MKRSFCCRVFLMVIILPTVATAKVDGHGIRFAASAAADGRRLPLRGAGLPRCMVFTQLLGDA